MDQAEQEPKNRFRAEVAELERFDNLARDAFKQPWWRAIVKAIQDRRSAFVNMLCEGKLEQRDEDRLRGQISELNFILFLDDQARRLLEESTQKGPSNG